MRLFSWTGCAALATAAGFGYLTCEAVHFSPGAGPVLPFVGMIEESESAAAYLTAELAVSPVEDIDLTCLPTKMAEQLFPSTAEPPLADTPGVTRTVSFEVPARVVESPEPPIAPATMPYLIDDAAPPAQLPPSVIDDHEASAAYPVRQCSEPNGPLWEAVRKFVAEAADGALSKSGTPPIGEQRSTPEVGSNGAGPHR